MLHAPCSMEKGVSLLFIVLIMSVILAIGLGISTIFVQETQMMTEIGYSVNAFYASDAGIEKVMMLDPPVSLAETELSNGAQYQVFVKSAGAEGCNALNYCLKSIGSYKTVKRAIEIRY